MTEFFRQTCDRHLEVDPLNKAVAIVVEGAKALGEFAIQEIVHSVYLTSPIHYILSIDISRKKSQRLRGCLPHNNF
ncbi:hypothetical protein [Aerosakkonema funiforme]|uniref:hypothetical protein n=1 Tax=Aerosakkonema funiforme TaxID=1246630 RepID=UPI0035BAAB53